MKRRLQKGRRRRRKGSNGMTFLSTLAHHLGKWLAPKKTPRSQPGRQAGRDSRTGSGNRRRVTRWLCCQFVFLQFFPPSRERKRAVNYARQSKCIHVRLLNVIYNQPAAAPSPFSDFFFSFAVHTRNHSLAFIPFNTNSNANCSVCTSRPRPARTQPAKSSAKICLPDCLAIIIITIIMRIIIIIIRKGGQL